MSNFPTTPGQVRTGRRANVSPAELMKIFLDGQLDEELAPAGAVVGGANDAQQQQGVVAIMDGGATKEDDSDILWRRCQIRCMAPSLDHVDDLGNHAYDLLHGQRWLEIEDSRGYTYFVHSIYCSTSPSHHIDSTETWESLLFATIAVGSDPVSTP